MRVKSKLSTGQPLLARAMQFDGTVASARAVLNWSGLTRNSAYYSVAPDESAFLVIRTSGGGDVRARPGDFVLVDDSGAVVPVRPDVFSETYEEVSGG